MKKFTGMFLALAFAFVTSANVVPKSDVTPKLIIVPQAGGGHSAILTWTASVTAGVTYNVYGGAGSGKEGTTAINTSAITGLTYTDSTSAFLTPGTTVCYEVKSFLATNTTGTQLSVASNEACGTVPTTAPLPPTNLTGTVQ